MPNVDKSDYAGLLIFGIFIINILLAVAGYKMNGKESAIASGALAVVGMWVGLGIVNLMDFNDSTPETVYFENHRELSDMNRITNDINMKKLS